MAGFLRAFLYSHIFLRVKEFLISYQMPLQGHAPNQTIERLSGCKECQSEAKLFPLQVIQSKPWRSKRGLSFLLSGNFSSSMTLRPAAP